MHPALLEPLAKLPLHSFPTPAARAALAARVLSEPGQADPDSADDPFVRVFRLAARDDMEPEVTGAIALVLLRGLMARGAAAHTPPTHAPSAPWLDPEHDPFHRRRPRLHELPWEGLWREVAAADSEAGLDPSLEFERITLRSSAAWLRAYRAWWLVADGLAGGLPTSAEARADLRARISATLGPAGAAVGDLAVPTPVELLRRALATGLAAEAAFLEETGGRPRTVVSARWLLEQQLRSLRDLARATRPRSLDLHRLVRRTDRARLVVQIAYRLVLLDLWLAPEDEALAIEEAVLGTRDPLHPTTLGAGLGRLVTAVLVRRLRRGEVAGGIELAHRAVELAPGELTALVAANDLAFHAGRKDGTWPATLLDDLRAEQDAWDSAAVRGMGARVARALADGPRRRWFVRGLTERAEGLGGIGWGLAATEALLDPTTRSDARTLERLVAGRPPPSDASHLDWIALGCTDREQREDALEAVELTLTQAALDLEEAAGLVRAPVQRQGHSKAPAWKQLLTRPLPSAPGAQCAALWTRVQDLRAAAPRLREAPLAGALRQALSTLADAVPWGDLVDPRGAELLAVLEALLEDTDGVEAAAAGVRRWEGPILEALRAPRREALHRELGLLDAELVVAGRDALRRAVGTLRGRVDAAVADPDLLTALHAELSALRAKAHAADPVPSEGLGLMRTHPDFDRFSAEELHIQPEALRQAHTLIRLFNLAGGNRDRKRIKGVQGMALFELRKRTDHLGGIRVFYRRQGEGWQALAGMSKYDDRQQDQAIARVVTCFGEAPRPDRRKRRDRKKR